MRLTVGLTGLTATVGQILLFRELLVVFQGSEISLGLMLACWLLWTAVGSGVLGRRRLRLEALLALEAVLLPAGIYAARASKPLIETAPGELLGPGAMLATAAVTLSGFCLAAGWAFASAGRLWSEAHGQKPADASREVYVWEAVGAAGGGLLASVVLLGRAGAFEIALALAVLNLTAAASLRAPGVKTIATAIIVAQACWLVGPYLQRTSQTRLWHGFQVAASEDSRYGNLTVIQGEGSRTVYESGLAVATAPDREAAEEAVHYTLLQHPDPKRVLMVGGGLAGGITEALRHPSVERLDYVELDPALIELARRELPEVWRGVERDKRVRVLAADGRGLLKQTGPRYDAILVSLPEPATAQLNRFFTVEFYREAAARMEPGGVLGCTVQGGENYLSPERAAFLRAIRKTLGEVFPEVAVLPGETIHFFASSRAGTLTRTAEGLLDRLRARGIRTEYVREYYLPYRMSPDRVAELERRMRPEAGTPVNRDFAPIAYYFGMTLWSGRFSGWFRDTLEAAPRMGFGVLAAAIAVVMVLLPAALGRRHLAALAAGTGGFTLMTLEMLLLLGFQALRGYVYHELALVTAALMAGVALGGWRGPAARLGGLQAGLGAAPLALVAVFQMLGSTGAEVVFPALALGCGWLGGRQYAASNGAFFAAGGKGAGAVYAADLAGASLGAMALSAYLVPVFGFWRTAALAGVANALLAIPLSRKVEGGGR